MSLVIGISPPEALESRKRLFEALSQAYDMQFEPRPLYHWDKLDALIAFLPMEQTRSWTAAPALPSLLIITNAPRIDAGEGRIVFTSSPAVHPVLRGRYLFDEYVKEWRMLDCHAGDAILATHDGMPIWLARGNCQFSSIPPDELLPDEPLIMRFRWGVFLQILPIVDLLRRLQKQNSWVAPPLRACFTFDDPNLHWCSYGYIDFGQMARHAEVHNYHACMATTPLDAWFALPSVARLFRQHGRRLSLAIHGNNHLKNELERPTSEAEALPMLAQALRRVSRFERMNSLSVDRVMVPPHGRCSESVTRALLRLGYEGVCLSGRPYPWLRKPPENRPAAGWGMTEMVAGGLPVLHRLSLDLWLEQESYRQNVLLQAYLNRPLIFVGHHQSLRNGLGALAEVARQVNSIGKVEWQSLGRIVSSNYMYRVQDNQLEMKLYARRVCISLPNEVREVKVFKSHFGDANDEEFVFCNGLAAGVGAAKPLVFRPANQARQIEITLIHQHQVGSAAVAPPHYSTWSFSRRILTTIRDRIQPMLSI